MSIWQGMLRSSRTWHSCPSVHFSEHSRTPISWSEPVPWGSCPVSVSSWSPPSWCWLSKRLWWICHRMSERRQLMPSQSFTGIIKHSVGSSVNGCNFSFPQYDKLYYSERKVWYFVFFEISNTTSSLLIMILHSFFPSKPGPWKQGAACWSDWEVARRQDHCKETSFVDF